MNSMVIKILFIQIDDLVNSAIQLPKIELPSLDYLGLHIEHNSAGQVSTNVT